MPDFKTSLAQAQTRAESEIARALRGLNTDLADACAYAVTGGKGLRAFLVLESARLHDILGAGQVAGAIEAMHAYSLIHDDLPCMDDDDLRRGRPTVHKKWDETIAVLAGDALQTLSFEMVSNAGCPAEARLDLVQSLAIASGLRGMVGGQMLDIAAERAEVPLTLEDIVQLQAGKTGALIKWSAMAGARMAQTDTTPLALYGEKLGLAFQIADDILDVEGDASTVGKAVGKDADAGKATFVSLLGLDEAKRRANTLVQEACDALSIYGEDGETLREAARFVVTRGH